MRLEERVLTYPRRRSRLGVSYSLVTGGVKLTIDVQLVDFSPDRPLFLGLSWDELAFDGLDQASPDGVKLGVKVRSVHLPGLTVRLVVYIFFAIAEGGRFACCGELIQPLGSCGREVDEP